MGWWGGAAGWEHWEPVWPIPSKDQCSQPGHRELPGEEAASLTAGEWVSAGSCFSGGYTGCLPEDLDGTLAHLSSPRNLVLFLVVEL